ncbi:phospholipase B1, membrane-associated-like [Homalodisca vitripennis]|nr:phospholipase B1, membrane-associated-like [Homalodisca vitripennis]XP_046667753.1 phospholipase B1, membrane-associated-like [Homalodisca vitripennis]XP_046667754.1 phospholipase B1, membrane-associated-like [Homalodisca vitripennis]
MIQLWSLLLLFMTAYSKVDDNVRYDSLIGRHMNMYTPYDGAKQLGNASFVSLYQSQPDGVRRQPQIPLSFKFPCPLETRRRSAERPTSVHRLRPGDIDVVGAMGDSLVAGNGALEEYALGTIIEYRGVSWCAGGEGTWREFLTVPNILKMFNPRLSGYSVGKGEFLSPNSHMNVAVPVSADADALKQARILVYKMKKDRGVDFHNDWKVITMFFGANDLCSGQCYDHTGTTPEAHAFKLRLALDYLQENLPRTLVNLVPVLDVSVSVRVKRSIMCRLLHRFFCTCFHLRGAADEMSIITDLVRGYQEAEELLVSSGRYNKKEDFTVVIQPFIKLFNAPTEPSRRYDEVIDISYVTYDCFHFSQKGHALAANLLWNNMLEPVGHKTTIGLDHVMQRFYCPTEQAPYIFTYNNSVQFLQTGRQD